MLIGDGAVGKSSLISQYDTRKFKKEYVRTIGIDQIRVNYTTQEDKYECVVKLWDTAGQERFESMTYQFFRECDAVIIVFDLTQRQTFEAVTKWLQSIYKYTSGSIPIVLVGNKCDLLAVEPDPVQKEEAQKLANENELRYFQTSAFTGEQVKEMVESTIEAVYAKKVKPILLAEKNGQQTEENIVLGKKNNPKAPRPEKAGCGC